MKRTVLIGDISSYKAIVICRFIKSYYSQTEILTFDTKKFTKIIRTKYSAKHFVIDPSLMVEQIRSIVSDYQVNFFFPVINERLNMFWADKSNYTGTLDYLGDFSSYQILNDKGKLYQLASKLGIKVPQQYDSIEKSVFPYVIKPANLSSAKGVLYIRGVKDLPGKVPDHLIIQQYIRGTGVGYSFYCKNGKILNGYGHKRLAEYPVSGGSSTYREGYQNREMIEIAAKMVAHLKYTGFAMFEYKLTPQNEIYLIEVNPRIWGSVNQGLENGVNYFEEMFGKPGIPMQKRKQELKTFLSPLIYSSLFGYSLKLKFKPILYFVKNMRYNSPDVSIIDDPKGYFSLLLRKLL